MRWAIFPLILSIANCGVATPYAPSQKREAVSATLGISLSEANARLAPVLVRVEPVAESVCRKSTQPGTNCDYAIFVEKRQDLSANAYQTVDKRGRPLIILTSALIAKTRNDDELAFVMGHEAAHHVAGHITRAKQDAVNGAVVGALLVGAVGGSGDMVDLAMNIGADVGARSFSKNYELEADALGTVIAHRAGYNPVRGAEFFNRIPDPGDKFLGTHPPNSSRMQVVRNTAAKL